MNIKEPNRLQLHIEVRDTKTQTLLQHTMGLNFSDTRVEGIEELDEQQLLEHSAGAVSALFYNMMVNLIERVRLEPPSFLVDADPKPFEKEQDDGNKETH